MLRRLRFSSLILVLTPFFLLGLIGYVAWGLFHSDKEALNLSLTLIAVIPAILVLLALTGFSLRCPLCRATLMRRASCSLNPKAQRTLGSLRLRVATGTLFRGQFRCPYCGEHCDTTKARR
jgi:predicted RNA-binding Zn-ribbon protein involved in translation (DUF1610 family)